MNHSETLRARVRKAAERGDWRTALRLGASIAHDLGGYGPVIARAHEAGWHPGFAQQLGRDPASTIAAGISALKVVFNIEESPMRTRPRPKPEKGSRAPRSRARKPEELAAGIDPAPEPEAAPGPAKPAPLELSRQELETGGTRIGVGTWLKHKNGAEITVRLDRKAGTWECVIERNGHRVRRQGRGYLTICRQCIDDLNSKEQSA